MHHAAMTDRAEAKIKIAGQWFYRGNLSPSWFAHASRPDGSMTGIAEGVPQECWIVLEEVVRLRALKERAAPQEPTNTTASPVSDSPTPAAAALHDADYRGRITTNTSADAMHENPYAGKNPRCAKGCPPETLCGYDECPGRKG